MQIKLELFSPEIVFPMEIKELLSHFRVCRKCATSAQTDAWIPTDGPLYAVTINCSLQIPMI